MKINGLNVNAEAIGEGIYRLICDANEEHLVAFGMIPKWAMDSLEKLLREKVLEIAAEQTQCTVPDLTPRSSSRSRAACRATRRSPVTREG